MSSGGNPEILVINLGLEANKVARFSLRLKDNPVLRVREFCVLHGLQDTIEQQLTKHVMETRETAIKSLREQTSNEGQESEGQDPFLEAIDEQIRDAEKVLSGRGGDKGAKEPGRGAPFTAGASKTLAKNKPQKSIKPNANSKWRRSGEKLNHSPIKETTQEYAEAENSGEEMREDYGHEPRETSPAEEQDRNQGYGFAQGTSTPGTTSRASVRSGNIHSRLYYDGLKKIALQDRYSAQKKMQESLELRESQIGRDRRCSPRDVVSRLYYNGVKHMAVKNLEREKIKIQEQNRELEGCTYSPSVSQVSKILAEVRQQRGPQRLEDALIMEGLEFMHKREQAAAMKLAQEMMSVKEKPDTNPTSIAIAKERSRLEGKDRVSCHDALFEDSYIRRNRTLVETEGLVPKPECTFHPSIDLHSAELVRHKRGDINVLERMAKYAAERDQRLQENLTRKAITETMIDPCTEQTLFQPQIGRPPASRNTQGLDVGAFLHNISYIQSHKKKQKLEQLYSRKNTEIGANAQSGELVESRKLLLFRQLFEKLDGDADGAISPDKVDVDAVDAGVLKYLAPLLLNMDEIGAVLDEHTFVDGMDQVYKSLSIPDRQHLLSFGKTRHNQSKFEEPTFTPALCARSLEIAQVKGRRSLVETASIAAKFAVRKKRTDWEEGEEEDAGSLLFASSQHQTEQQRRPSGQNQSQTEASQDKPSFQPQLTQYKSISSHYV